ncbi:MAG: hypothetical protein QXU08_05855, partial [Ignisphaera sp.]
IKTRHSYEDAKVQRVVNKVVRVIKIATYILALGIAGYGAWWFTIPGGETIGVVLILAGILISVLASRELKVKEGE